MSKSTLSVSSAHNPPRGAAGSAAFSWMGDAFKNPAALYRGKPFWSWNGELDPAELKRQIHVFREMGFGGFVIHSRIGLITGYLSEDWFAAVQVCLEEAERLGLEVWIYDEDRWPSGSAGGLVTEDPANRMRYIVADQHANWDGVTWSHDVLAVFLMAGSGAGMRSVARLPQGRKKQALKKGESLLVIRLKFAPECDLYNGNTYLDTLNPEAVRAFIERTHEEYRRRFGKYFGKTLTAFFTDEAQNGGKLDGVGKQSTNNGAGLPWTGRLAEVFSERYGYDLLDHLPELFYDLEGTGIRPARLHYHDCVTHLFAVAFTEQIAKWCQRNKVFLTGHVLMEDLLSGQASSVGSNMRALESMQAPGMDLLTEFWRVYGAVKQVSSVANQMGRMWRLSETYGCTGWDFSFEGHKALGDWQAALGINLRCHHLAWYTAAGEAKRDYPASIFYQSPWWDRYAPVEEYYGRIHIAMTQGKELRHVLFIHPVESMWLLCRKGWVDAPQVAAMDEEFILMTHTLLDANLDFDYGDEGMMAKMAKVVKGPSSVVLKVGQAEYTTVVVPSMLTMRASTLKILERFRQAGGSVVFGGKIAEYVDANPSDAVLELAGKSFHSPTIGKRFLQAVAARGRALSITDKDDRQIGAALYLLRQDEHAYYLFIANTGCRYNSSKRIDKNPFLTTRPPADIPVAERNLAYDEVYVSGFEGAEGEPLELDPHTGEVFSASAVQEGTEWRIRTSLPKLGSRLFVVPKKRSGKSKPPVPSFESKKSRLLKPADFAVSLSECNVGVLDQPAWGMDGGKLHNPQEILQIDRVLRDKLGVAYRGGDALQPWKKGFVANAKTIPIELCYQFEVADMPSGELFIGIENPELYHVFLNEEPVFTGMDSGWWFDPSLRRIPLKPSQLRKGRNTIRLQTDFSENHPGLEIIYLLGNFGVSFKNDTVTLQTPVKRLKVGNWVNQGLPFYSGNVCYQSHFNASLASAEKLFVSVENASCAALGIRVNGEDAGLLFCSPWQIDITPYVKNGGNDLIIEVIGHRRNSHGPFHCDQAKPLFTGPGTFTVESGAWTNHYRLVPCGLMQPPALVIKTEVKAT